MPSLAGCHTSLPAPHFPHACPRGWLPSFACLRPTGYSPTHYLDIDIRRVAVLLRVGVTIQADDEDEMPERLLAGCYLTHPDPTRGAPIDPELELFLHDPASAPPLARLNVTVM